MKQLKIVVLCGGLSTERNISFLTGSRVCSALRSRGHKAVLADLYMGFDEAGDGEDSFDPEALFEKLPPIPEYSFDGQAPDLEAV
ncbi:MAG: D-alanine--D-alanine ligase, partial [Lachnospiraceae bacterium]|nr:D-alanine--D-alanine ligase [Lachnospiraceae bacterium]